MLHEIRVNGYAAEADGPLDLGTWGSYGTEQPHFTFDAAALAQTSAQVAQAAAQDAVRVAASGSNLSVDKSITNRTASSGSGQAHNNMPPYYTVGAQIRARRDVLMLELLGSE